jgi:hypothetical protein
MERVMSLPFNKGRNQDREETGVSQENRLEVRPKRDEEKRWRGIEIGFKLRITKVRRKSRYQPQGRTLNAVPNALLDASATSDPSEDDQTDETTLAAVFCLTPPTDPPGPPK